MRRYELPYLKRRHLWQNRETLKLLALAEKGNAEYIAEKLGRPVPTIATKMQKLGVRAYAGTHTLIGIARDTGYHYTQIEAARDALGQVWRRTSKRFIITEKQYQELMGYFRNGVGRDQGTYGSAA